MIGYDDVFSEALDVFADPVVVLAKQETPLLLFFFNRELIEILRKIEPFAGFVIMAFYELLTDPVGLLTFSRRSIRTCCRLSSFLSNEYLCLAAVLGL